MTVPMVVFGSGSMSSMRFLYENDPNYGVLYSFVGVVYDTPGASGAEYALEKIGVPAVGFGYRKWTQNEGVDFADKQARQRFFGRVLNFVRAMEPAPEAVMLSGHMLLFTEPLLSAFPGRILNVHPAFLSIVDDEGRRRYRGMDVVGRAMRDGAPTGSTVHIVTVEADEGPIVCESDPLPYKPDDDPGEHQERMKFACDGPAYQLALQLLIDAGWPASPWLG